MSLTPTDTVSLARSFFDAARAPHLHPRPSHTSSISVDEAYGVQAAQVALMEAGGESVVAIKLGLTDQGQRDAQGWNAPSFGTLTNAMILREGDEFSVAGSIMPRVEPEIVVVLGAEITSSITLDALASQIASIHVGIEIVDPRFDDPAFILTDALCDNAAARSGVWAAHGLSPHDIDLSELTATLSIDGDVVLTGHGSALMGNPLLLVKEVIDERLRLGLPVPKGLAIFTGNLAGKAHAVTAGQEVVVSAGALGEITLRTVA